jgi:transglutaminase-like putative cysteine protease
VKSTGLLSDSDHPLVVETAHRIAKDKETELEKLESLFHYVRDEIKFGFPSTAAEWDTVTASHVIAAGYGYCNTKATLLVALCRATGITARVHYGWIDAQVMHGIFPFFAFPFLPKAGPHSWTEVELEGEWRPMDSYINDEPLFRAARRKLEGSGREMGYSLACSAGKCSCEFNFGEQGFVHMGAVVEDHGPWEDASIYMATDRYFRFNAVQRLFYPVIAAISKGNIERLRSSAA